MSRDKRKRFKKHYLNTDKKKIDSNKNYPLGYLSVTRKGFGFVSLQPGQEGVDDEVKDIFIPAQYVGNALSGDLVSVRITDLFNNKGPSGEVVKVVERSREAFVGQIIELDAAGRRAIVKPISSAFSRTLAVIINGVEVVNGDWIEFSIKNTKDGDRGFDCEFVRVLDRGNQVSGLLDGLTVEFELPEAYTAEEEAKAAALPALEIARQDLTKLTTMTIDPVDAKDFDDALSVYSESDKDIVIAIHIADVAA
jgi:ribonuclease R